jgi:hypothetical protein
VSVEIGLNGVERLCAQRSPAFISTGKDLTLRERTCDSGKRNRSRKVSSSIRRFFRVGVSKWYGMLASTLF